MFSCRTGAKRCQTSFRRGKHVDFDDTLTLFLTAQELAQGIDVTVRDYVPSGVYCLGARRERASRVEDEACRSDHTREP